MVKLRKICLERRREKDPAARKSLSIADILFMTASELGAPSRLKEAPPILEKLSTDDHTDRIENLQGRTEILHDHFKELFTDPLRWETLE